MLILDEIWQVLILRLLAMLTAKPTPLSVQDVEDRVSIIISIIVNFGISISNINISIILNATILTLNGSNQMRRKIFHVSNRLPMFALFICTFVSKCLNGTYASFWLG